MPGMNTGFEGKRTLHDTAVFDETVLANGVTLWRQKLSIHYDRKGIVLACLPGIGSVCDPEDALGCAHFFEHAPFLGTERRPSYQAVWAPIDDLCGDMNAGTSKRSILYRCTLPQDHFRLAAETVFELAAKPLIRDEDIITERGTILKERKDRLSDGATAANWAVAEAFFKKPLCAPVIGYPESISAMTADHLRSFYEQHFRSGNLHVVVGGAFAETDIVPIIGDLFGSLPARPAELPVEISFSYEGKREVLVNSNFGIDRLYISWIIDGNFAKAASLLMDHLAADMTSPLVAVFRKKMGALYGKGWASSSFALGRTAIEMTIPIDSPHFSFAEGLVYDELRKITPEMIVRRQRISQLGRDYNCPHPVSEVIDGVRDIVEHGRIRPYHEVEEEKDNLTVESVLAVRDLLLETTPFVCETKISR